MNIFKRILAILLVCVFVGTALVGCSKKQGNEEPTGSNGTEETEQGTNKYNEVTFDSALKESEFDFDGEKITVMHRSGEIIEREWHKKSPEDELDQAVAIRNATVEEHLNIELNYEVVQWGDYDTSAANFNSKVLDDYNSGTHY